MSAPKLTKKQKKGLAFRERKDKKPRLERGAILEEELAVPQADSPVDDVEEEEEGEGEAGARHPPPVLVSGRQTKSGAKSKKRKRDHDEAGAGAETGTAGGGDDGDGDMPGEDSTRTKEKERTQPADKDDSSARKTKRRKVSEEPGEESAKAGAGKARFILFVGNLKYTTSLDAIKEHFTPCDPPPQIRLLTPKPKKSPAHTTTAPTTKSKGCAFLEFSHRNALQQGLKLHGSTLDGRRINVELTAGGGGKSETRVQKVQARNKHLLEERKARVQKAAEAGADADTILIAPPQRHSTTSGLEEVPQKRRTWTVPEAGEASGRGGVKKRGKKGKSLPRHLGTGANAVAVG